MYNNDSNKLGSRNGHKCSFSNIVVLKRQSTGEIRACPVDDVKRSGSRSYSLRSLAKRLHPSVQGLIVMSDCPLEANNPQSGPQLLTTHDINESESEKKEHLIATVAVTRNCSMKRYHKPLCILMTVGGILLIHRKKLIGIVNSLRKKAVCK